MNFFAVALMYLGAVIGAGFASGREVWQYFGVFGKNAYFGLCIEGVMFLILGIMTTFIARTIHTESVHKVILPLRNSKLDKALGILIGILLYIPLVSMSAAGGALLNQEFGIHRAFGGAIIVFLVIITLLGDFERVQRVFKYVMPVLFLAVVSIALYVVITYKNGSMDVTVEPSKLASSWPMAAVLYVSYNSLGTIPIMAKTAIRAKDRNHAVGGAILGGAMLATLGAVLVLALQRDPALSHRLDLPLLGFASNLSPILGAFFSIVLLVAMYSAATSCFYGCISGLMGKEPKKVVIIILGISAFFLGLAGFKNIVAIVYPVKGYIDLIIITLLTINFLRVFLRERHKLDNYRRFFHDKKTSIG